MITYSTDDTSAHLIAGRRAAMAEFAEMVAANPRSKWEACPVEEYDGGPITVNGGNIERAIDAAVLETVARLTAPLVVHADETKLRYLRPGVLPL